MVDSRLAFDILARDHASSAFEKVARSADKTAATIAKTGKISDSVAKSSANLTKAHNRESDALDKVQIAEARLAEVRGNSNSKTSQILAAEKALAKARRDAAVAGNVAQKAAKDLGTALDNEGKKAGKSAGKSVLHWFTGAGKDFEKAGKLGGEGISSGLMGALKTPVLGPAILAGATAVVATAAPAAGAIVAGGIVAGFGAGLGALGIVFAAKSVAVKNAWSRVLASMGADMQLLSRPFEKTLIAMAGIAKRTFAAFKPALTDAFKSIAPVLTQFGSQLGRAFEELAPAIRPLSGAFTEVLKSLGPAMQSAFRNVSKGLQDLATSVQNSPDGLADLVKGMGDVTRTLLDGITTLNNINGAFERLTGGTSAVEVVMKGLQIAIGGVLGPLKLLEKGINGINALTHSTDASGQSMSDAANKTVLLAQGLKLAGTAAGGTASQAQRLAALFDRQWAATQRVNDALTRQSGQLLALSGSEIAYQAAVDDATASIKENGRTHDINTAKGRANKSALDQVAASAQAQTVAMRNAGDGNVAAAKAATSSRASFVKLAVQMGYSKAEAERMAQSLIKIPNVTRTAKLQANKKDLETKLAEAQTALKNPNLTKERRAKLTADIANAKSGIATINGMLGNLPKSKTISINIFRNLLETVTHQDIGVRAPGRAVGGPVTKGMPYVVGEHRPELFVPKESGTIVPRVPRTAKGAAFAASGGGMNVTINVNGSRDPHATAAEVVRELRKYIRVNGGNVQGVLGR